MSVASGIRTAAAAAISALSLSPAPAVASRRRAILPAGKTAPAIVVATGEAGDVEVLYPGHVLVRYPLTVACFLATSGAEQNDDTLDTWRTAIGRALDERTVFGADCNEVYRADQTEFESALLDIGYEVSVQRFTVEMIEART